MKKATQRVLSLLLAAVLLFGMLPMSAFAAETEQMGIATPEVDVTDPPEMAESEPVESVGDDTMDLTKLKKPFSRRATPPAAHRNGQKL